MLSILTFIIIGCLAVLLVKVTPFLFEFAWSITPLVWDISKILTVLLLCTFALLYFSCWYMLYFLAFFSKVNFRGSILFKAFKNISNHFRRKTTPKSNVKSSPVNSAEKRVVIDETRQEQKNNSSYSYPMIELDDLFVSVGRYVTHYKIVSVRDLSKKFCINIERVNYILSQLLVYDVIGRAPKTGTLVVKMSEDKFENLLSDPNIQAGIPKNEFRMLHEKPILYSKY